MMVSCSDGGGGSGGSGGDNNNDEEEDNDKEEDNNKSRKRTFDQSNEQDHERDRNLPEGGNNECDDFDFSEHSESSHNDGGPENWQYGPSFTTNRIVLETRGYMLAGPVYRPLVMR